MFINNLKIFEIIKIPCGTGQEKNNNQQVKGFPTGGK
jgi:hypothetical protein